MRQNFIGYADLPPMLADIPPGNRVYVNVGFKDTYGKGKFASLGTRHAHLIVQVLDDQNNVRFIKTRLGSTQIVNGEPWDGQGEKLRDRALSAEAIITAWLRHHGYQPVDALVAMPANLETLLSQPSCLRYDKATDRFVRTDHLPQEAQ